MINTPPIASALIDELGKALPAFANWLTQVYRICFDVQNSGTTAQRPVANLYVGKPYFDTTLGQPIWVRSSPPTVWINAAGAAV